MTYLYRRIIVAMQPDIFNCYYDVCTHSRIQISLLQDNFILPFRTFSSENKILFKILYDIYFNLSYFSFWKYNFV